MMKISQLFILKTEIEQDPLSRGYISMDDLAVANDLNSTYRDLNIMSLTASKVFNAISKTEFNALSDAEKNLVWDILHMHELNPFGLEADIFTDIFGTGSQTVTNLKILRKTTQTRAKELGLPKVYAFNVTQAKEM